MKAPQISPEESIATKLLARRRAAVAAQMNAVLDPENGKLLEYCQLIKHQVPKGLKSVLGK